MTNSPGTAANGGRSAPITERRYLGPFILITSLFFLWAFGVNLNDILIPHLKKAFGLTDFQSSFIQVAFFGGYFLAAFPAGRVMEKIGYKKGILAGLFLCATGAVLFLPASSSRVYGFFLFALFVMACGQSFLEVASNPYVTIRGPLTSAESAERVLSHAHLVKGVIAQFFYVGAQVGVASFVIRYAQFSVPGTTAKVAALYLLLHQVGFMAGRFIGSALMKKVAAPGLLSLFAGASLVCATVALLATGVIPVWAVVFIGFFHSIMFPTIFALGIKNLGALTKRGSSLMVMAIVGGAFFPAIMGRISDAVSIQKAFLVPLLCYVYILYFGVRGYKHAAVPGLASTSLGNESAP